MKIAVVGSGIAGLSAAWLLSRRHCVTLFEREGRPGGHCNTVVVPGMHEGEAVSVDTGFIVYNTRSYPNLVALFDHLGVETARSDMSFAFSLNEGAYEYSGTGLGGIFGQGLNVLRPSHLGMLLEIRRFFGQARQLLAEPTRSQQSLGDFLLANRYSQAFIRRHILPMAAAICRARLIRCWRFQWWHLPASLPIMGSCKSRTGRNGAPSLVAPESMWIGCFRISGANWPLSVP